eukprot:CAMPEP_0194400254 /NCGR_PEP_ID=MMETSP0174-20130528/127108_1 /TAXON_ID=216777 /ORGANISM="Proboscia alata, Strain PI-D3" /LENGTH=881 /DNA_ID=CAMNT_0039196743 /DNA_START=80 /DNA_END=2725 /DNA_ORIENTATION=-
MISLSSPVHWWVVLLQLGLLPIVVVYAFTPPSSSITTSTLKLRNAYSYTNDRHFHHVQQQLRTIVYSGFDNSFDRRRSKLQMTSSNDKQQYESSNASASASASASSSDGSSIEIQTIMVEAEALRAKAREIRLEANNAEQILASNRAAKRSSSNSELDVLIDTVLCSSTEVVEPTLVAAGNNNGDASIKALAERIQQQKIGSIDTLLRLINRIHERESNASRSFKAASKGAVPTPTSNAAQSFVIGNVNNSIDNNQAEMKQLDGLLDLVVGAILFLDEQRAIADPSSKITSHGKMLQSHVKELRTNEEMDQQRRAAAESLRNSNDPRSKASSALQPQSNTIDTLIRQSLFGTNATSASNNNRKFPLMDVMSIPRWVPASLLGYVATCANAAVDPKDMDILRKEVLGDGGGNGNLGSSPFIIKSTYQTKFAACFKGEFRNKVVSNSAVDSNNEESTTINTVFDVLKQIYQKNRQLQQKGNKDKTTNAASSTASISNRDESIKLGYEAINLRFETARNTNGSLLSKRIQLFLLDDPEYNPRLDYNNEGPQSMILALSTNVQPLGNRQEESDNELRRLQGGGNGIASKGLPVLAVIFSLVTTITYTVAIYALNPYLHDNQSDLSSPLSIPLLVNQCLPVALGIFALQAVHEISHMLAAKHYNIKLGWPIPLPSLQIGMFGSITPYQSFPNQRRDLFDVSMSGPTVTLLLSTLLSALGLYLTVASSSFEVISTYPVVPCTLLRSSVVLGTVTSFIAPKLMLLPPTQVIPLHPLFLIGLTGLFSSALNLLPIGRLDGGRASMAVYGRRSASLISLLMLLGSSLLALSGTSRICTFFGLWVVLFQRNLDLPTRNEISELDDKRVVFYGITLFFSMLVLLPFPGGVSP